MDSNIAIRVSNLTKKYTLGKSKEGTLRESLTSFFNRKSKREDFLALNNLSFEIEKGDIVGIIGKNGAGKSTLLKVLSQITKPTEGKIEINGRIASLLEVGTGFHPELTGRENVFLNGTILGMTRKEVAQKFDEIVAFSGIEKFIDTAVKHYSSGMYVRLAFAVAAHLESEILIIDEVLAVGDAEFQKKCLGKIGEVSNSGRTVLFVSHDMTVVQSLCTKGIVLSEGKKHFEGNSQDAIAKYNAKASIEFDEKLISPGVFLLKENSHAKGSILGRTLVNGIPCSDVKTGDDFEIQVEVNNPEMFNDILFGFQINNELNTGIIGIHNRNTGYRLLNQQFQKATIGIKIPNNTFYGEGRYTIDIWLGDYNEPFEMLTAAMSFNLIKTDVYASAYLLEFTNNKMANASFELYGIVNNEG